MKNLLLVPLLLTGIALAANPQDEQVVRSAYAKLAYASQSRVVYFEAMKNAKLTSTELAQKLQDHELHFEITEMSSGALSEIDSRPYTDFVSKPDGRPTLDISFGTHTATEDGLNYVSHFATPGWHKYSDAAPADWNPSMKEVGAFTIMKKFTRYVAATITVGCQGQLRTYQTLWLFGSTDPSDDPLAVDLVAGQVVRDFALESAYPSVLTDTKVRSQSAVKNWLESTQRSDSSCKTGKQDICCDLATLRCGVHSEDLRSTKPAPTTTVAKKEGL